MLGYEGKDYSYGPSPEICNNLFCYALQNLLLIIPCVLDYNFFSRCKFFVQYYEK